MAEHKSDDDTIFLFNTNNGVKEKLHFIKNSLKEISPFLMAKNYSKGCSSPESLRN